MKIAFVLGIIDRRELSFLGDRFRIAMRFANFDEVSGITEALTKFGTVVATVARILDQAKQGRRKSETMIAFFRL